MHLHFHHHHDLAGCVTEHPDWPEWAVALFATLDRRDLQAMSANSDALAALGQQLAAVQSDVAHLASVHQAEEALDFGPVQAQVADIAAKVQALLPAPPAPVVEPPAAASDVPAPSDVPAQPAEVTTPAADGTVPVQSVPSVPLA